MGAPKTGTVAGVEVTCIPLPEYPRGAELMGELLHIAMPALAELGAAIKGKLDLSRPPAELAAQVLASLGPDGAGKILAAFEGSVRRLIRDDPGTFQRVSGLLLSTCEARVPDGAGGSRPILLSTPARIQEAVAASGAGYAFLFGLLKFALGANYADPFGVALGGTSSGARPASPTPTP